MPEPDRLRSMLSTFIQALMSAEADAVCDACCGTCSAERTNTRNGYRSRDFDTRAGTVSVRFRRCERAPNFPDWLLERRKRAEMALVSVVATSYLLGPSTTADGEAGGAAGHQPIVKSQVSAPVM
jgi:transposase-like protein